MFTWIPTYLKKERDLTVVGTRGLPVRGHRGRVPGLPDAPGFVHDRLGRGARRSRCSRRWRASSLVAYFLVPGGLEHDAADRRLPARLLRLGLLLGLRLLPGRAVPDAGARRPAGASVTTSAAASARCSRASSASSRRPSGSAARSPSACSATCSRSARCGSAGDARQGARAGRVTALVGRAARRARPTTSSSRATPGAPVWPAHEPGVLLNLHRRHERGRGGGAHERLGAAGDGRALGHAHRRALPPGRERRAARRRRGRRARCRPRRASPRSGIDTVAPLVARGVLLDVRGPPARRRSAPTRARARRGGARDRARATWCSSGSARARCGTTAAAYLAAGGIDATASRWLRRRAAAGGRRRQHGVGRAGRATTPSSARSPGHMILLVRDGHLHHRVALPRGARAPTACASSRSSACR